MEYHVTTCYIFTALDTKDLPSIKREMEEQAASLAILGLVLIAEEGMNATIAGSAGSIAGYKEYLTGRFGALKFKDSVSPASPFKRFKVKIKEEIVQLKRPDLRPAPEDKHVSPEEWDAMIEREDVTLIDVRNWYEVKLGTFRGAINPKTWEFSQFPGWLKKSAVPKDKKVAIFCTGGIRCEKAAVAMKEQGYKEVYQLDGGILKYIEQRPRRNFEGDCFVFDHRVAVGQDLRPSQQYSHCWHCGNGGSLDQACSRCGSEYRICEDCTAALPAPLCSKNCRYQYSLSA